MNNITVAGIKLSNLTNDAYMQFHKHQIDIIRNSNVNEINGHKAFTDYCAAVAYLDSLENNMIASRFTVFIKKASQNRDNSYKSIIGTAKIQRKNFDEDIRAAAEKVLKPCGLYGNIPRKKITEANEAYGDFLRVLNSEYEDEIIKIGAKYWVEKLKEFNDEVNANMNLRFDEKKAKDVTKFRAYRKVVDDLYRFNIKRIEASIVLNGATKALVDLVNGMNVIVKEYAR